MLNHTRFAAALGGIALWWMVLSGCSSKAQVPWGTASGKVTLGGNPVAVGTVVFANPSLGVARTAELQPDGTYKMTSVDFAGLPTGTYRVAVTPLPMSRGDFVPVGRPKAQQAGGSIPLKYHEADTSGLEAVVKEGRNEPFNFDLEK